MDAREYTYYTRVLKEQLIPATGCTEPIALAYAAAVGRKTLGTMPEKVTAAVSGSIVKNVKSVVVPATGGMKGIETAVAAGIVVGREDSALEVLSCAPADTAQKITLFKERCPVRVELSQSERVFDIQITMEADGHTSLVRIVDAHTNIVLIKRDDEILLEKEIPGEDESAQEGELLEISKIVKYASICSLSDVSETIEHQIACNTALSKEGMSGGWGAEIGRILLSGKEAPDVKLRAMAAAAAGSDARMSGCEIPAVINSGSGNQGLTVTMPIVEYAKE
ncbi:MAG: L-serine ammonia-lyase, iron-sulfur-dependent, subunit alpha, partial [Lachnospiraceae bacterium]|nr:L-serine ammonia-lyase, iron-sulfur-dependent, subunit alpha [Lachnospiraceae bacterium]